MVGRLLHGTLEVTIVGIDKLHHGCGFSLCFRGAQPLKRKFQAQYKRTKVAFQKIVGAKIYATVDLDKARVGRTRTLPHQPTRPHWMETFHIYCAHFVENVIFTVKNDEAVGATLIGRAYVPVEEVIKGNLMERWVDILDEDHHPIMGGSKIYVKMRFSPVTQDPNWSQGIGSPQFAGVPYTFYNQREGCKVTLYQDAHVADDFRPEIRLSEGKLYEPHRCWEDVFDAITNAKHLIYITGWSVYTEITLIRDPRRPRPGGDMTLGELLKEKADEGVRVLLLVWDDRTSIKQLKEDGLMSTHDEETRKYFRHTKVRCYLCPRNPDGGRSIIQGFKTATMFTHHQKTLIVDSEVPGGGSEKRRIVSFVGGLDLCDGRYDTQDHTLFKTLSTTHSKDFYQPNFDGSSIKKGGPREPWHDIHCKLEGSVAWDVLDNFEQRWRKQVGRRHLISERDLKELTISALSPVVPPDDPERWSVQLFRSIDCGAVVGFPVDHEKAAERGLVSGKDSIIDRSIQDAYIKAIRRAKHFIYIENQYFVGSSFAWKPGDIVVEDINASNLIPRELSLKIVSKIESGERFAVYIVIPMWPEGKPTNGSVQAILDWQRRTIEVMYSDIADALRNKGLNTNPREYLSFFCLGNRETKKPDEYIPPAETPDPNTDYFRAQQARRFMIYVHSKLMIVDDEYIIVGSANINQRSMEGGRDSEIAMGAFQPNHLGTLERARGQIFGFRMALWREHLGSIDESFYEPESEKCIRHVNDVADHFWGLYSGKQLDDDLPGHLLPYPIDVAFQLAITTRPGTPLFPDTRAPVLGSKSTLFPPVLTT